MPISYALLILFVILSVVVLAVSRWSKRHEDLLLRAAHAIRQWFLDLPVARVVRRWFPAFTKFFGGRLSAEGYLGLHLTTGLVLSIGALVSFAEIADQINDREGLSQLDEKLDDALHARATPNSVRFFKGVSLLGSVPWVAAVALGVVAILIVKRKRLLLIGWLVALAGAGLLDDGLKRLFRRPRPHFDEPFVMLRSWSFPSGHSMGSLVLYGMAAYLLIILSAFRWRMRAATITVTVLVVLAIGFSRLYLGAHYLTDVIGGYAAGLVWLSACITGLEVARRHAALRDRENEPARLQ